MSMFHDSEPPLKDSDAQAVAGELSDLIQSGLPLPEGLRALADELGRGRAVGVLLRLADRIEAGESLDQALQEVGGLPRHLQGLIEAGVQSGNLSRVLEEYVDLQHDRAELRRSMWRAVAYPILLFGMIGGLLVLFGVFVVPQFREIFDNFAAELPSMTQLMLSFFSTGIWFFLGFVAVGIGLFLLALFGPVPRVVRSCVYHIPIFGPFWRWSRLMPFARLMALFTEQNTPLPEALRWTAAGMDDFHLAAGCRRAAEQVEAGESLNLSLGSTEVFPVSMLPVLNWGERYGSIATAFRFVANSFQNRTQLQTDLAHLVVLPMLVIFLVFVGFTVISLFLPLIRLIECLS